MNIGQQILDEIIKQGMVTVAHCDPENGSVLVWNANTQDQLHASVSSLIHSCDHPSEHVDMLGSHFLWCGVCGAVASRRFNPPKWETPSLQ